MTQREKIPITWGYDTSVVVGMLNLADGVMWFSPSLRQSEMPVCAYRIIESEMIDGTMRIKSAELLHLPATIPGYAWQAQGALPKRDKIVPVSDAQVRETEDVPPLPAPTPMDFVDVFRKEFRP